MMAASGSSTNSQSTLKCPVCPRPVRKFPTGIHVARCSDRLWCAASAVTFAGSAGRFAQSSVDSVTMFHSASSIDRAVEASATAVITPRRPCSKRQPNKPFKRAPRAGRTGMSQRRDTAVIGPPPP